MTVLWQFLGNDFEAGSVDVFYGNECLKDCYLMPIYPYLQSMTIKHSGDAWYPIWIRTIFEDGSYAQCDINKWIEDTTEKFSRCRYTKSEN